MSLVVPILQARKGSAGLSCDVELSLVVSLSTRILSVMDQRMLLETTLEVPPRSTDGVTGTPEWQTYLMEQASGHPLFRRHRLGIQGGTGFVVLTGKVSSFYEKQVAQEFFRRCEGVQQIDNRIEVAYAE